MTQSSGQLRGDIEKEVVASLPIKDSSLHEIGDDK